VQQVVGAFHGRLARLARRSVDREVGRDAEHIRHRVVMAPGPQVRVTAVTGVRQYPGERHVGRAGVLEHRDGQLGLGGEGDLVGHPGLTAPLTVVRPFLGQIQTAVDEGVSGGGGVGEHHHGLAVADIAGQPTVLEGHPDRLGALLLRLGVIDDE
jgi:hypothetical protein